MVDWVAARSSVAIRRSTLPPVGHRLQLLVPCPTDGPDDGVPQLCRVVAFAFQALPDSLKQTGKVS